MFPACLTSALLSIVVGISEFKSFLSSVNGQETVIPADQDEIHQDFLKQAKVKWEEQLNSIDSYSINCHLERRNEGLPADPGGSEQIHAKRLGSLVLVEFLNNQSRKSSVLSINADYYFQLESYDLQHWQLVAIGESAAPNTITQELSNRVYQPDFMHLMFGGGMRLTDVPWENSVAVKLVTAMVVETFHDHRIVELEFNFDFDDSVKTIAGDSGHAIKSAKFVFETVHWKPLSAIVDYDSGREKIKFTHTNDFDEVGRLSSRTDRLEFQGTDIISVVKIDQFEPAPIPHASEFRLPHYGLPEYKESSTNWLWVVLFFTVALVAIAIIRNSKVWAGS